MKTFNRLVLAIALVVPGGMAIAQTDSNADGAAYTDMVANSQAVVLRVPVSENGTEDRSLAEMRFVPADGRVIAEDGDVVAAFDTGIAVETAPVLEGDASGDSSTWGWCNYRSYYGSYYNYRPYYNYYGSYYNYGWGGYYRSNYRYNRYNYYWYW